MKKLITIIISIIFISCETEEIIQETCICNNAKFYIPKIDEKSDTTPPNLGLNYTYFQNIELDCVTGLPLLLPTENAKFIKCED